MARPGFASAQRGEVHRGVGLGHEFLRHITRCRILLFVVDVAGSEGRNPIEDVQYLRREIDLYDPMLSQRPWFLIANKMDFGFQVTETGSGFTRSMNSHENRLIPWSNDAVSDPPGEAIYIRDEETGAFWTPTPLPVREAQPYLVRHGQGYTVIEHISHGISQELLVFVPLDAPVKVSLLRLQNRTDRARPPPRYRILAPSSVCPA